MTGRDEMLLIPFCMLSFPPDSARDQSKTSGMGMFRKQENMTRFHGFTQTQTDGSIQGPSPLLLQKYNCSVLNLSLQMASNFALTKDIDTVLIKVGT